MNTHHIKILLSDIPIYWINLDRSLDRRENMINMFKQYNITNHIRIEAIDGCNLENTRKLTKNELGCLLSHYKAIKMAHQNNLDYVIIMEDDVDFSTLKYRNLPIKQLFKLLPESRCIQTFINTIERLNTKHYVHNDNWSVKGHKDGTVMYVLNKQGILDNVNMSHNIKSPADHAVYYNTCTFMTIPYVLTNIGESTIRNYPSNMVSVSDIFWRNYYLQHDKTLIIVGNIDIEYNNSNILYLTRAKIKQYCFDDIVFYIVARYSFCHLLIMDDTDNGSIDKYICKSVEQFKKYEGVPSPNIFMSRNTCTGIACGEKKDYFGIVMFDYAM